VRSPAGVLQRVVPAVRERDVTHAQRRLQAQVAVTATVCAHIAGAGPVSAWDSLARELAHWREAARTPTFWLRDDDACRDTPALARLFAASARHGVPLSLAVVPAALEPGLVTSVAQAPLVTVVQHGFAHVNHAPAGARAAELGDDRAGAAVLGELAQGDAVLARAFGERYLHVLVPPWNRIGEAIVPQLAAAGYRGLSTFAPRTAPAAAPGLAQCNAHVDPIAWRRGRAFVGDDAAVTRVVDHLAARREGRVDAGEPTGLLTHHLVFDDAAWAFFEALFAATRAQGATWLDTRAAFGLARGAAAPATCGRST
jgi:hypothetical protein